MTPVKLGSVTLVGARTERAQLDRPALIWLKTLWHIDARTSSDLVIASRALPPA